MPRYDVFLSHASADKPAVERLARKLRDEGVKPFLDKWHLIPGEPWQEGMEEALRESRTCAVFIGKALGPWQNEEMRTALARRVKNRSYRVIPVLLPGGPEAGLDDLSEFLGRHTWVDFRPGLDDEDAFRRLLAGIRGEVPGPGGGGEPRAFLDRYRCMAPAREPFVQRSEYAKVRDALLADGTGRATTVGITTAIHGAGGFGKTALATELCYDEQVREHYPAGILWTTMGEEIDAAGRLARVRDLIRWWTEKDPPAFETVSAASARLRQELAGKRVLLVVDDVWRPEDVTPFQGLSRAALLVTTRDSRTLPTDTVPVHVDAMATPEAVQLLRTGLPGGADADLETLAARLGEWPLLLKLVNRQVKGWIDKGLDLRGAIRRAESVLKAKGLTHFDRRCADERSQAVAVSLEVSLERLSEEEQRRYAQLAIFPEDANVPLSVLEKLWQLDSFDVEELASRLFDLSLLRNLDLHSIRLHDVIRAYLLKKGESQLAEWHRRLLDAYRPANGRWPDLPRDERYLWNHLVHHLLGAGQSDVCRYLLLDFHYLRSKLSATDVNALLADYSVFAEKDTELRLVRDALRLSAHVLASNQSQLREQLWGRLLDRQEVGIRGLLQERSDAFWLRPRRPCLTRPGGALIRTIDHPGGPEALAVLPDGRVVTGSFGVLWVWDVESGQGLQFLGGHSAWINAVAVLDNRRIVSGSALDETLRVWDVESGKVLQALEGSSGVKAVAVLDSRRLIAAGFRNGALRVWDVESRQVLQVLEGYSDQVNVVAVLDSRRVVSGADGGKLRVWDVESGQVLQILEGDSSSINAVAVIDGRRVVTGSDDGRLRLWDVESGQILQILEGRSSPIKAVAVIDRRVVSGSDDGMLWVWDLESGRVLQALEGHHDRIQAVAALDSRRVVSIAHDETLRVWDMEGGHASEDGVRHSSSVTAVAVLESGRIVSGSSDQTLRVWDVRSGKSLQILEGHSDSVAAVAALGSRRVISGSCDGTLRVWDVESGQSLHVLEGHSDLVNAVAVLDSHRAVSGCDDGTLRVWDLESGKCLQALEERAGAVNAVAVLDGRVVAGSEEALRVWCVRSGKFLQILEEHLDSVDALAVMDSRRVVSSSYRGTLRVWDVESGNVVQILEGRFLWVNAIAVLDRNRVVVGSDDRTIRVWDVENGEVESLFTHDAPVTAVAVIPDLRVIVAGDTSGRVHFFDFVEP